MNEYRVPCFFESQNQLTVYLLLCWIDYCHMTAISTVMSSLLNAHTRLIWPPFVAVKMESRSSTVPKTTAKRRSGFIALLEQSPVCWLTVVGSVKPLKTNLWTMTSSYRRTFQFLIVLQTSLTIHRTRPGRHLQALRNNRRLTPVRGSWRAMRRTTLVVSTSTWSRRSSLVFSIFRQGDVTFHYYSGSYAASLNFFATSSPYISSQISQFGNSVVELRGGKRGLGLHPDRHRFILRRGSGTLPKP